MDTVSAIARTLLLNKSLEEAIALVPGLLEFLAERLRPSEGFTAEQRELLDSVALRVEDLEVMASVLETRGPNDSGFIALPATDGYSYLNADLLTDCMREGDTYHWAIAYLQSLHITDKTTITFIEPDLG